jgi:glycosyltransferase involved in cell wall biosynthesis
VVNGCGFDPPDGLVASGSRRLRWAATYIGRLQPEKGMDDLLQTWSVVTEMFPDAELLLIGFATPGHQRQILRRSQALGLEGRVHLAGVVSEADKWAAMAQSRLCLFLSPIEGWGLVPLEALSIGLPVVLYDLPAYRESLADLKGVIRVPIGDIAAAAKATAQLLALDASTRADFTREIASAFHYPTWQEVAAREAALIQAG